MLRRRGSCFIYRGLQKRLEKQLRGNFRLVQTGGFDPHFEEGARRVGPLSSAILGPELSTVEYRAHA